MRVVICMSNGPTGERFESVLRARGHDVVRVDLLSRAAVLDLAPDVLVCDRRATRIARSASPSAHIITTLSKLEDKFVASAVQAGATDVIACAARSEELVTRVTLPERMASTQTGGAPAVGELWGDPKTPIESHLAAILQRPITHAEAKREQASAAAQVRLTRNDHGSTLDLMVGCSESSARTLMRMLAPGMTYGDALFQDVLRELANNLAGALKRSLTSQGARITLGLPVDCDSEAWTRTETNWSVVIEDAVLSFAVHIGQAVQRRLSIAELVPGMVLQHDVLNAAGVPFVRVGSALTERTIDRLRDVLGESFLVSVAGGEEAEELENTGLLLFEAS